MTGTTRNILIITILTTGLNSGRADSRSEPSDQPQPSLTVRLYNHAGVPGDVMLSATQIARRIYRDLGIETRWASCMMKEGQPAAPLCATPPDVTHLFVRLGSEADAVKFGAPENTSGYAMPAEKGKFGSTTILFYNRISKQAAQSGVAVEILLGHMIAHEIAHLLLGRDPKGGDSHSKSGIMKIPWGRRELRLASTGALRFHKKEARLLTSGAVARVRHTLRETGDQSLLARSDHVR